MLHGEISGIRKEKCRDILQNSRFSSLPGVLWDGGKLFFPVESLQFRKAGMVQLLGRKDDWCVRDFFLCFLRGEKLSLKKLAFWELHFSSPC